MRSLAKTRAGSAIIAGVIVAALLGAAHAQERPRLTFAQLSDSLRANFDVTKEMKSCGGREVDIQGFIVPAGPPDLSFFLLSRSSALGNYCCEAPVGQDETVYVFAPRGARVAYDPLRVYRVRGTFEAGKHVDASYGVSMFRIRDAKVEEAVGARIFKVGESPKP